MERSSPKETLAYLKREAKGVEKTKKHYKNKSEYYRMMYERSVTIEALEAAINHIEDDRQKGTK